jgi:hypothetical protein
MYEVGQAKPDTKHKNVLLRLSFNGQTTNLCMTCLFPTNKNDWSASTSRNGKGTVMQPTVPFFLFLTFTFPLFTTMY